MPGPRMVALSLVALIAASVGASCGADDDSPDIASSTSSNVASAVPVPQDRPADPAVAKKPKAEAAETVNDIQDSLRIADGGGVCRELTTTAQENVAKSGGASCERVVERTVRRWYAEGTPPIMATVRSVRIDGKKAKVALGNEVDGSYDVEVLSIGWGLWLAPRLSLDDPTRPLS